MYCPSCGVAVVPGLSFCNHCGAQLTRTNEQKKSSEPRPESLIGAMAALFIFGLPGIVFLIFMLNAGLHLGRGEIMAFAWVTLSLMLVLEIAFMRLLFRRKSHPEPGPDAEQFKGPVTKELDAMHARSLVEPVGSVTEHTTRTFDPIYRDQGSK
jgi:hypothetical protein